MTRTAAALLALALPALGACGGPTPTVADEIGRSGELVALSGAGAGAANACFTCHGLDGGGDGAGVPRIAGLDPGYLMHSLEAYADGRRHNPSMRWIAKQLDPSERVRVSLYYSRMDPAGPKRGPVTGPPEIYVAGAPDRGIAACASCHGTNAQGHGSGFPALAGQPAAYIEAQLENWRLGKRQSDPSGSMLHIARRITPEEASEVASYVSSLPASARPESREAFPAGHRHDPRNGASEPHRHEPGS